MKLCKHCGKELDNEANFCPYCMNRQEQPSAVPQIKIKRRISKTLLYLMIGLVALSAALAALLLIPKSKPQDQNENTDAPPSAEALETNSSAYDLYKEFDSLLGADYKEVKSFFGTETAPVTIDPFTEAETHYFNGIEFAVIPATGKIISYIIDYQQSDPPHRYNYRGIDSSATFGQIQALLGPPSDDSGYPFEVTYALEQGYIKFSFDDQLHVTKIYALYPYE